MKKYKCIGLDDNNFNVWAMYFSIGEEYEEAELDKYQKKYSQKESRILIKDKSNTKWWVPKDQFKLIEDD